MILVYEVCSILRVTKKCNLPSNGCEVVDGNLGDGGTTLACLDCCGCPSLEDTV